MGTDEHRVEQAIPSWDRDETASGARGALGECDPTSVKHNANRLEMQISIVTSLASYSNPLSRMGGVEYVAEVSLMRQLWWPC